MSESIRGERVVLAAILALAGLLLLFNIDRPRLWQDEAETALLARNVLRFGVPRVWDGENLVAQYYDLDYNADLIFQKPWLPVYLVSGFMVVLGQGTLAARLPFALCGLLAVFLTWRAGRRLTRDGVAGLLAALLLATALPFLTYSRQCRWYALAMAATLLLVEAEDRLDEKNGWVLFAAAAAVLFHTNYLVLAALVPGLLAARLGTRGSRTGPRPLVKAFGAAALVCLPFWLFFPPFGFAGQSTDLSDLPYRVAWVAGDLNRYLLPLPAMVLLLVFPARSLLHEAWFRRLALVVVVAFPLSCLAMWKGLVEVIGFRYTVNLLPIAAILLAGIFRAAGRRTRFLTAGLAVAHLVVHLGFPLSLWPPAGRPGFFRADLIDFVTSIAHPVRGPIDAATEYLDKHARPGDFLYTPYEQLPLQFYTGVRTVSLPGTGEKTARLGVELPRYVSRLTLDTIAWYLPRRDWEGFLGSPPESELLRLMGPLGQSAERIVLDAPDLAWQTREYPPAVNFRLPADVPPVVLYRFSR